MNNLNFNFVRSNLDQTVLTSEQLELVNCEFCDDHIKRRYIEMKDIFYKIFKTYIRLIKFIKNKEEVNLKKSIDEIGNAQIEFINCRNLLKKLIAHRKNLENDNSPGKKLLRIEGVDEKEKKEFFDDLTLRKEGFKKYRKNIVELEMIASNIQECLEMIYLNNCIVKNDL